MNKSTCFIHETQGNANFPEKNTEEKKNSMSKLERMYARGNKIVFKAYKIKTS